MSSTSSSTPLLVWFRQDLRVTDHPALTAAAATGRPLVPVYVLDDTTPGVWRAGAASRWWLHHSLESLGRQLGALGLRLILRRGPALTALQQLLDETGAGGLYCTRAFEPWARHDEDRLARLGIDFRRFPGSILFDPDMIGTATGTPFRVFTPFWNACRAAAAPVPPLPPPGRLTAPRTVPRSDSLADWSLVPTRPDWAAGLRATWHPGEPPAQERLARIATGVLEHYLETRDRPDLDATSRLSPHLHFGEVSVNQCWHAAGAAVAATPGAEAFRRQLGWREFCYHLLYQWPTLPERPFHPKFARLRYAADPDAQDRWQRGRTGIPIVDAGMRQLWHSGWLHNRVRMIAASLLTKNLRVHWRTGAAWFWDTLVDADLANNSASWQWVAGSGADAAPYFRIFNPVLQGRKFDPDGSYVRRYVPELRPLAARYVHAPWEAPARTLAAGGIELGTTYPYPCVDLGESRRRALAEYRALGRQP